jgi:type VI secretion system protein ImpF
MADLSQQERLQPSLLDRLIDDDPTNPQESREKRVLTMKQLRAAVLRDLSWLFNCEALSHSEDLEAYPNVQTTVLNYGLPPLTGRLGSSIDSIDIERTLKSVIRNFEPRILNRNLRVRLLPIEDRKNPNALAFEIEADLWAQPIPLSLFLRTDLDLEMGQAEVAEGSRSS